MYTYDIREAWTESAGAGYVRVSMVFDCADMGNHHMDVQRVALVLDDGSDVETEAKAQARMLCDYHNLRARYKGMLPK